MKPSTLGQLSHLLKPYRAEVFLSVFLSFLPAYFAVWNPYLIGKLIDEGIVAGDRERLFLFGALICGSRVLVFVFNALVSYCLSSFGFQILVDYRDQLLKKILNYPISFFDRLSSGQLTTRLTSDINSLQELFATALVPLIGNSLLILGVMAGMVIINWKLALLSFSILPVLFWLTAVFHFRIRKRFGLMREALSSLNSFAAESFSGVRDLQVFNALEANKNEFDRYSRRLQNRYLEAVREYATFNPTVPFVTMVMDILIVAYGGWQVYYRQMSVGDVVAFLAYASNFGGPIRDFAEKYTVFQQALAAMDRLLEISNHEEEKDFGLTSLGPVPQIRFESVGFSYPGAPTPALHEISFQADAGQKIALMGETGSGKTTTCSLLLRFYQPNSGTISLGGKDLNAYSLDSLRSSFGWVSQDVVLFSTDLRENLRFFDARVSDSEIWEILALVQLESWARSLPAGLETQLSERGAGVSSGQRQLISLARALLRSPKILIFDEATAYVDSHTEFLLQQAIEKIWESKKFQTVTGFFIAHRLSTLRKCDRMLVFRQGRIVESGSFSDLMRLDGYAAKLYKEQFRKLELAS